MGLLKKYLLEAIGQMERDRVKMEFFGDLSPLTPELRELCQRTREISRHYEGCQVNICLNYGGRDELVRAAQAFARDCIDGRADPNHLNADQLSGYLYSRGVPDPELIIRTSGELRLSNFLLWQAAYSEFYITDVLWPDFSREELHIGNLLHLLLVFLGHIVSVLYVKVYFLPFYSINLAGESQEKKPPSQGRRFRIYLV